MQASTFTDNLPMPSSFSCTRNTFPSTHSSTFSSSHNYPILVGNTVLNHKNSSYSMKLLVFQKFLLFAFTRVTPLLNTSSLWTPPGSLNSSCIIFLYFQIDYAIRTGLRNKFDTHIPTFLATPQAEDAYLLFPPVF